MTNKIKKLSAEDLAQFTGDLQRYRHGLNRQVIYTPGVQFLAERAGAYWLIDAIASYFGTPVMQKAIKDEGVGGIQFWRLDVAEDDSAVLTARADSDKVPFITQQIQYTDFPLPSVDVWAGFDGELWTLYLPSEH